MKKNLIRCGLFALALTTGLSATAATAQECNAVYVTPKIIFSKQEGSMDRASWVRPDGQRTRILGGSDRDDDFGFGVSVGNDFSYSTDYPVRVEVEYLYHGEGKFSKGPRVFQYGGTSHVFSHDFKTKAHSLMLNAFYDINIDSIITPYVGGGLGLSYIKSDYTASISGNTNDAFSLSNHDWDFAWNVGGGISYAIDNQMALDVGYRYFDLGTAEPGSRHDARYNGSPKLDLTAHEIGVGLRFSGF